MIYAAERLTSRPTLPFPLEKRLRRGINYERNLVLALTASKPLPIQLLHNPWFKYYTAPAGPSRFCCPDILFIDSEFNYIIVAEVKLTWTPIALQKLRELYLPIVTKVYGLPVKSLVICKNLLPSAPEPKLRLSEAFSSPHPVFQWLERGPILW